MLDLSGAIGAYCGRLLADLGADVVLVEPPTGHELRHRPPFKDGASGPDASLAFVAYNVNKRSVTLDVGRPDAEGLLGELARDADVIVMSPTKQQPVVGVDRDNLTVSWAPASALVVSITPFGLTGPYRDYRATPFTSFAMGGVMHRSGPSDSPYATPDQHPWDETALLATASTIAALRTRDRTGGQLLDISVHELQGARDFAFERSDFEDFKLDARVAGYGIPPGGQWECADGPLDIACHQLHHWDAFLRMVDHPDELSEESLADPMLRREIFDGLSEIIGGMLAQRSRLDLFRIGQSEGLPCSPLNTPGEFVADIQVEARGIFSTIDQPGLGTVTVPWQPFHSTPTMIELRTPAPRLGEHNQQIYGDALGHSPAELEKWSRDGLV